MVLILGVSWSARKQQLFYETKNVQGAAFHNNIVECINMHILIF